MGNPFGLNQSASLGIVSATGRRGLTESQVENFIQTDAAINLGNSGGALVNPLGQVVGISTASYNQIGAEGINFAIPSNTTVQIINSIIEYGQVLRGWLGIYFIQPYGHAVYQIPKPIIGIMVSKTRAGSSADLAGIQTRDVITHINDRPVNTFSEYQNQLLQHTVGDVVKVTGYNDNGGFEMYLTIELPPSINPTGKRSHRRTGIAVLVHSSADRGWFYGSRLFKIYCRGCESSIPPDSPLCAWLLVLNHG